MKKLILFAIFIASFNCYAQITFEKGYFIKNSGERIECFIKNLDWKNNPTSFKYKLNTSSQTRTNGIKEIKEFGINNTSKYIRYTIDIDRSSNNIEKLSYDKSPIFNTEILFLKVLIDSKTSLYSYTKHGLKRFFTLLTRIML